IPTAAPIAARINPIGDDQRSIEIILSLYASGTCSLCAGIFTFLTPHEVREKAGQNTAMIAILTP
ncbi:MAG: hypothetical protein PHF57_07645, partial [Methanoregula sp.]|nr:hypothetical protein [Methanoregula sp.]